MPLYDFQCEDCGKIFEVRASIKQREHGLKPECPDCHSHDTHGLITAGLVILNNAQGGASTSRSCGCGANVGPGCCG